MSIEQASNTFSALSQVSMTPREPSKEEITRVREDLRTSLHSQYLLEDPAVAISLRGLLNIANIERQVINKSQISTAARSFAPFYEAHLRGREEIIEFEHRKSKTPNCRVLHDEASGVIDYLVSLEEDPQFRRAHHQDNSVHLTSVINQANKIRLAQGRESLSSSAHYLERFYEENCGSLPMVEKVHNDSARRSSWYYLVFREDIDDLIDRLVSMERPVWEPEARGEADARRFAEEYLYPLFADYFDSTPVREQVYGLVRTEVRHFLIKRLGADIAEDLLQSVIERLTPFLDGSIGRAGSLKETWGYIYTTTRNAINMYFRKSKKQDNITDVNETVIFGHDPLGKQSDFTYELETGEYEEIISQLRPSYGTIIRILLNQEPSDQQLADLLTKMEGKFVSNGAAVARKYRAKKALAKLLERHSVRE